MTSASPALADDRETDASIEQRAVRGRVALHPLLALAYFFNYRTARASASRRSR